MVRKYRTSFPSDELSPRMFCFFTRFCSDEGVEGGGEIQEEKADVGVYDFQVGIVHKMASSVERFFLYVQW